jgi:hypothetical protein
MSRLGQIILNRLGSQILISISDEHKMVGMNILFGHKRLAGEVVRGRTREAGGRGF